MIESRTLYQPFSNTIQRGVAPWNSSTTTFNTWTLVRIPKLADFFLIINSIVPIPGKFRHYDYETPTRNLEYYGQVEPPEYDLQKITAPSVVFWGPNDPLSTEQNVQLLIGKLRNSSMISQVVRQEKFNHIDFIVAKDAKKLIHDPLVQILMKVHGPQCQVD